MAAWRALLAGMCPPNHAENCAQEPQLAPASMYQADPNPANIQTRASSSSPTLPWLLEVNISNTLIHKLSAFL